MAILWTAAIGVANAQSSGSDSEPDEGLNSTAPGELVFDAQDFMHPDDEGWRLRFEPAVGYFAPSGDLGLPAPQSNTSDPVTTLADLNLDSPRLTPYGEFLVGHGKWSITFSGFGLGIEAGTVSAIDDRIGDMIIVPGDTIRTELDYATLGVRGGYRVHRWVSEYESDGVPVLATRADLLFGLRAHDVDVSSRLSPQSVVAGRVLAAQSDSTFVEPVAGLSVEIEYMQKIGLDFYFAAGGLPAGDLTSFSVDLGVGFHYRPFPRVGTTIGYRLLVLGLEDGSGADRFEWKGAVAGLYWGLRLDF